MEESEYAFEHVWVHVPLNHPRGSIRTARAVLREHVPGGYVAIVWMGRGDIAPAGRRVYTEYMCTHSVLPLIHREYEFGDDRSSPSYINMGDQYIQSGEHSPVHPIQSMEDWETWVRYYLRTLDPRDAFRDYRRASMMTLARSRPEGAL